MSWRRVENDQIYGMKKILNKNVKGGILVILRDCFLNNSIPFKTLFKMFLLMYMGVCLFVCVPVVCRCLRIAPLGIELQSVVTAENQTKVLYKKRDLSH